MPFLLYFSVLIGASLNQKTLLYIVAGWTSHAKGPASQIQRETMFLHKGHRNSNAVYYNRTVLCRVGRRRMPVSRSTSLCVCSSTSCRASSSCRRTSLPGVPCCPAANTSSYYGVTATLPAGTDVARAPTDVRSPGTDVPWPVDAVPPSSCCS